MHELSATQSILDISLEKANEAKARKIIGINIVIGELSGIVEEFVRFYFDLISRDTIAAEASLSFAKVPTQLRCRNCGTVFSPDDSRWLCPKCQAQKIDIMLGRECSVDSIEVE